MIVGYTRNYKKRKQGCPRCHDTDSQKEFDDGKWVECCECGKQYPNPNANNEGRIAPKETTDER